MMKKTLLLVLSCALVFGLSAQYQNIGSWNSQGVPNYLEPTNDALSLDFLEDVNASLPERKPVPTYNPHYLTDVNDLDLRLVDSAEVWITFVHEGAGWKNSLAYYTYDLNNPPATAPTDAELTLVFPNFSYQYGGGGMNSGNKVLLGSFSADTGIGFALITRGWQRNSQSVVNNYYTVYSNPDFNPESDEDLRQHCVTLSDTQREVLLIGFEDINREWGGCDNDFNDAIFYATASPYSAIEVENMPVVVNTDIGCNSVPENLRATAIGLYKATLTWDDFNEADSFRIRYREWGTDNDWEYRNAGGATSLTLGEVLYDHLQPGTWYEWQAATTCDGVQTSNSVKHVFKTLTPCEMPTGNAATNLTDSGARVSWSSVLDAENYVMRYRKVGETDYNWRNTGELTYFDITGLDPSSTYEWGVSASCSELESCIAPYLDNYSFETNEEGRAADDLQEVCAIDVNDLTFTQILQHGSSFENVGMLQGDANNDGMDDVILFSTEPSNSVEVFTQSNPFTSNLGSSTTISFADNYTNCTLGHIDNDGKIDLLLTDMHSNKVHFYRNASIGSTVHFDKMYSMSTDLMPSSAHLVDLQGSATSELVVSFSGTDQIKLYKKQLLSDDANREPNAWEHYKQFITGESPSMIKSADIDSNGKQDLMIMNDLNEHFTLVYNGNEADSTYYIRSVFPTGGLTKNASIGDLNGDGLLDVVALSQTEQTVSIYQNIGQPENMMLELVDVQVLTAIPNDAVIGDMNGDGMGDLVLSFLDQSDLLVYQSLNADQVIMSSPNTINTNGPAGELSVMDMNGDGFSEIICSGNDGSSLTVFGNNTPEVAPMVSISKSKSADFQFNAQADFVSTDWQWQAKDVQSGIWLDLEEQKGIDGSTSTTLVLDRSIAMNYAAVRCSAKDRSCNQLHVSEMLKIKVNQEELAKLLPNPATDLFTVFVSDASTSEIEISVLSATGELVEYIREQGTEGSFKKSIDVSTWSSGVYYVKIKSNSIQSVEKLIVQ